MILKWYFSVPCFSCVFHSLFKTLWKITQFFFSLFVHLLFSFLSFFFNIFSYIFFGKILLFLLFLLFFIFINLKIYKLIIFIFINICQKFSEKIWQKLFEFTFICFWQNIDIFFSKIDNAEMSEKMSKIRWYFLWFSML